MVGPTWSCAWAFGTSLCSYSNNKMSWLSFIPFLTMSSDCRWSLLCYAKVAQKPIPEGWELPTTRVKSTWGVWHRGLKNYPWLLGQAPSVSWKMIAPRVTKGQGKARLPCNKSGSALWQTTWKTSSRGVASIPLIFFAFEINSASLGLWEQVWVWSSFQKSAKSIWVSVLTRHYLSSYKLEKKIAYSYLNVIILRKTSGIFSLKMFTPAQPPSMIRKHFVMPTDCLWEVFQEKYNWC